MIWAICIVLCVAIICYTIYKEDELNYKKHESEYTRDTLKERTELEVEQERTKQQLLDKEKEAERTKQLELKANYRKETGDSLW